MPEPSSSHAARFLQQPTRALPVLLVVALVIEGAQYFPEVIPGFHALGEVTRNLAYALIGAVIFHWLIVEIPAARRRSSTYDFHRQVFQVLLVAGPGLLYQYQHAAQVLGEDLDIWDSGSISRLARKMATVEPNVFGPDRAGLLKSTSEIGVPRALDELKPSVAYLDLDVAHALSQFPRQEGITTMLQVKVTASGGVEPERDAYITWSLLEGARRLYAALLESGAYDSSIFQGSIGDNDVKLSPKVLIRD